MRTLVMGSGTRPSLSRVLLAWLAVGCLVLALSLGTNFMRPVVLGLKVAAEIVQHKYDCRQQRVQNDNLRAELSFLQSEAGKRWAAWRYLGMVEPGWQVGRTVEEKDGSQPVRSRPERLQRWLTAQQEARTAELRHLGEILLTYGLGHALDEVPAARNSAGDGLSNKNTGTPVPVQVTHP